MYNSPSLIQHKHALISLTNREQEVLRLIAYEHTSKEIAALLYLSAHTVDSHKKNLKLKLDVKNTAGLVRRGFELGILQIINAA